VGEGSVFRRKDGRWVAKWKDVNGKWRYLYRKSKGEAKRALREALKDRDDNIVPADKLTLADALDQWLDDIRDGVSRRTYINRESLVLCKLTPADLRAFYREKLITLSPATVGRLHDVINKACKEQVRKRRLRTNPAAEVKPPKNRDRDMDVLTPEQVKGLLETVHGSRYEAIIVLGATCALRIGEVLALRYEDLDLDEGTLSIRRTLWKGGVYPPKTPHSRRTLRLPAIALDTLRKHAERHGEPTEGYLFATSNGTPIAPENFWRWGWKPALRKAGLPESLHFHDLRHGAASLLLCQRVPVPVVSKYLGHADPSITMKVYAHVIDGASGLAAAGMDEALG
jgi:integrase